MSEKSNLDFQPDFEPTAQRLEGASREEVLDEVRSFLQHARGSSLPLEANRDVQGQISEALSALEGGDAKPAQETLEQLKETYLRQTELIDALLEQLKQEKTTPENEAAS